MLQDKLDAACLFKNSWLVSKIVLKKEEEEDGSSSFCTSYMEEEWSIVIEIKATIVGGGSTVQLDSRIR